MKKLFSFSAYTLLAATLVPALFPDADAATVTWAGGDGQYTDGANWTGGSVPNTNGGDTAQINSGNVTYTPGGDLAIHSGGALVISGGSWTQAGGIAWIQLGGGNLSVTGGTFNQGTAGNIVRDATTTIDISGGVANFSGNFLNEAAGGTFSITGGSVNVANEFKPLSTFSMTVGGLSANLISFADGPGGINFSGGTISVNGAGFYSGFYGGGGSKALNFTTGSTGSLFFSSYTLADLAADGFLNNGTIQLDGAVSPGSFLAVESGGGVLVTAVPESSHSLLLLGSVGTFFLIRRRQSA